ncbi:hypothetical protein RDV78_11015 [Bacillota bacterium LX-D]|nr:hypothetical protein [Bacillota bacterium LX-D]
MGRHNCAHQGTDGGRGAAGGKGHGACKAQSQGGGSFRRAALCKLRRADVGCVQGGSARWPH